MSVKSKATAEVFFTAFQARPNEDRDDVLVRIAGDRSLRRDLLDLATIAERQQETLRPSTNTSASVAMVRLVA